MPSERQIIGDGQGDGDANASAASKSARAQKRDRQKAQAQQKQAVAVASPEEDPNAGVHSQERLPSVAELLGQEQLALPSANAPLADDQNRAAPQVSQASQRPSPSNEPSAAGASERSFDTLPEFVNDQLVLVSSFYKDLPEGVKTSHGGSAS